MKLSDDIKAEREIEELRRALKTAQAGEYRAKRKSEELVEAVYRAAYDSGIAVGRSKQLSKPPQKDTRKSKQEIALVHATDWQLGKKTISYGMTTCAARMDQLIDKVLTLTEIQRSHHPVKKLIVLFGGDMVEGITVFPGQAWEIEAHLFEQLFEASRIMEKMIRVYASYFETVQVVCEFGNHGRLGRKGELPSGDNIDAMAYRITKDRVQDLNNVSWQMSNDWYQIVIAGEYRALLVHGDEVKSSGGIVRKANAWATGVIEPFQDVYMGHFHTPMAVTMANGGRIFVTGSPESHNEYAREFIGATSVPSQRVHFIDPAKGRVTAEYVVWLE